MADMVYTKDGKEINVMDLQRDQLGVRVRIFLGEDENGNYIGDPPNLSVDVCYECYDGYIRGEEDNWIPTGMSEYDLAHRTFEEIFADGEVWEWDDLNGMDIFRWDGYYCNQCNQELLDAVYDIGDGKERPTVWNHDWNQQVKV